MSERPQEPLTWQQAGFREGIDFALGILDARRRYYHDRRIARSHHFAQPSQPGIIEAEIIELIKRISARRTV